MSEMICPCGHNKKIYTECCQSLHQGTDVAMSPEQLMRSRYSAFVQQEIDYIVKTTAIGQQPQLDVCALRDWSCTTQWHHLEVLQHDLARDKRHAFVEFKAYFMQGTQLQSHHEKSAFVYVGQQWYFLDPTVDTYYTMKQPCICGSDKKFKACCSQFLSL